MARGESDEPWDLPVPVPDLSSDEEDEGEFPDESYEGMSRLVTQVREREVPPEARPVVVHNPILFDDFVRDFLEKKGWTQSRLAFEDDWQELAGPLAERYGGLKNMAVPDPYLQYARLQGRVYTLREQLARASARATAATKLQEKAKREREEQRMHHRRLNQENTKLKKELKHYSEKCGKYDPDVEEMQQKHDDASRDKMVIDLEKERLQTRVRSLKAALKELEASRQEHTEGSQSDRGSADSKTKDRTPVPAKFSPDNTPVDFSSLQYEAPEQPSSWSARQIVEGHGSAISCVTVHPSKPFAFTGSDDTTWRLWSARTGELIVSGEGHTDFVAGLAVHPGGQHLVTASGDSTSKVWDFFSGRCIATHKDHSSVVWSADFHHSGDFFATASSDFTARMYDFECGTCVRTLRDHKDNVVTAKWLSSTNTLGTASTDGTLRLWDARTGKGSAILQHDDPQRRFPMFGMCLAQRADKAVACDARGNVVMWDLRTSGKQELDFSCGDYPANGVALDRSSTYLAVAGEDSSVHLHCLKPVEHQPQQVMLKGHSDAVLAVAWDSTGTHLVSTSADGHWQAWF